MPDEDNNFGDSLVLDFRKWRRHAAQEYPYCSCCFKAYQFLVSSFSLKVPALCCFCWTLKLSYSGFPLFFPFSLQSRFFKKMPSSSRLPKNHNIPLPGIMRFLCFFVCLGVLLLLCLLHFTDMTDNSPPFPAVVSPREVPGNQFGNRINKLNRNKKITAFINSLKRQGNSRTSVFQTKKSLISRGLEDFQHEWLRQRRARVD